MFFREDVLLLVGMPLTVPADHLREYLKEGEELLWSGRPNPDRRPNVAPFIFGLVFTGFSVFWTYMAWQSGAPVGFVLFGFPFVAVGLYLMFIRPQVEATRLRNTAYGITTDRVLVLVANRRTSLVALDMANLPPLSVDAEPDGSGTIRFGEDVYSRMARTRRRVHTAPRFEMIADARNVYDLITEVQAAYRRS